MIEAQLEAGRGFASRLAEKALRIAAARIEVRRRRRAGDPHRWRRAALLWPNFSGER